MTAPAAGSLAVLHAGTGDVEVVISSEAELKRTLDIVQQMIKRGFAILVRLPDSDKYARVREVDVKTGEYVISMPAKERKPVKVKGEPSTKRLPVRSSHAVAVGRSAGG